MKNSIYSHGLDKNPANYVAQTPLTFIERSARVYPNHTAVIHGSILMSVAANLPLHYIKSG
jgi:fatty-acyl-CoA synthase